MPYSQPEYVPAELRIPVFRVADTQLCGAVSALRGLHVHDKGVQGEPGVEHWGVVKLDMWRIAPGGVEAAADHHPLEARRAPGDECNQKESCGRDVRDAHQRLEVELVRLLPRASLKSRPPGSAAVPERA